VISLGLRGKCAAVLMAVPCGLLGRYAVAQTPGLADSQPATLEEVTVTGSRIARDGMESPTPVTVVGQARMESLASPNIADVLNTLPSFRATASPQTANIQPHDAGTSQADLRGLGPNRTLVLVDGRRFVPSTLEGTVDLNQIPNILIDRTEVVTGGASAQYGSDAVAGVVNLIMKHDLQGVQAQLQYGETQQQDSRDTLAALAGGTSFADGRGHVTSAIEYEDNRGAGTCYSRVWCAQEYQVITNPGTATVPKLAGYPANNILSGAHTVTAVNGGLIVSGPLKGTAFSANGTPYPFQYGQVFPNNSTFMAGGQGVGENGFLAAPQLVIPDKRYIGLVNAEYAFTPSIKGSLEISYGHVESNAQGAQTRDTSAGSVITIHGDNPYLPAGVQAALTSAGLPLTQASSFTLGRMGTDFGYTDNQASTSLTRVLASLKGDLVGSWTWDAYYEYGEARSDQVIGNDRIQEQVAGVPLATGAPSRIQLAADAVIDPATGSIVCRSTLTHPGNGCQPVDLFGLNQYSAAAKGYLYGTAYQSQDYIQHVAALNLQGDLFHTWAGPVPLAAGVEYRSNATSTAADPISATSGFYVFNSSIVSGHVHVKEGYIESTIPLLKEQAWANLLELNGAARFTNYNTSGSVTTYKYGGVYEPTSWLRLRGTRSRDIRAPNTSELYSPHTTAFQTIDGALTPTVSGGNPNLTPEVAGTTTAGFTVVGAGVLTGLRASVDWYSINLQNAIATLTAQVLVNRCRQEGAYCDLVSFNPNGTVAQVNTLSQNLNRVQTSGFDFELDYRWSLSAGFVDMNFLATRLEHLKTTDATGLSIDRAGVDGNNVSGGGAGLPHWQMNNLLAFTGGATTVSLTTRYIQGGLFDATLIGPGQPGYNVNLPNSINNNHVAGAIYFDLGLRYKLPVMKSDLLEVYASIDNLLDRNPPVAPSNQGSTNNILFDPLGRDFRVGMRASF
jgi:iron complex outermembrane recepter protein